jgi:hypothetical protein
MIAGGVEVAGDHQRPPLATELRLDPPELGSPADAVLAQRRHHVDRVEPHPAGPEDDRGPDERRAVDVVDLCVCEWEPGPDDDPECAPAGLSPPAREAAKDAGPPQPGGGVGVDLLQGQDVGGDGQDLVGDPPTSGLPWWMLALNSRRPGTVPAGDRTGLAKPIPGQGRGDKHPGRGRRHQHQRPAAPLEGAAEDHQGRRSEQGASTRRHAPEGWTPRRAATPGRRRTPPAAR